VILHPSTASFFEDACTAGLHLVLTSTRRNGSSTSIQEQAEELRALNLRALNDGAAVHATGPGSLVATSAPTTSKNSSHVRPARVHTAVIWTADDDGSSPRYAFRCSRWACSVCCAISITSPAVAVAGSFTNERWMNGLPPETSAGSAWGMKDNIILMDDKLHTAGITRAPTQYQHSRYPLNQLPSHTSRSAPARQTSPARPLPPRRRSSRRSRSRSRSRDALRARPRDDLDPRV